MRKNEIIFLSLASLHVFTFAKHRIGLWCFSITYFAFDSELYKCEYSYVSNVSWFYLYLLRDISKCYLRNSTLFKFIVIHS